MSTFLRQATNAARSAPHVRAFTSTNVARRDLVQAIYLREINAYKPAPAAKDAHVGVVKTYALPPTPKVPTVPTDLAAELTAYDAAEPTRAQTVAPSGSEEDGGSADAFLSFLEQDISKPVHHH